MSTIGNILLLSNKQNQNHDKLVDLITVRQPLTGRYVRFLKSISKICKVNLITGTLTSMTHLGMNPKTLSSYAITLGKAFGRGPALLDAVSAGCYLLRERRNLVVDFRMPLSPQLAWLGHQTLAKIFQKMENACIKNGALVIAANEILASMCQELGVVNVMVVPNYPTKDFRPTSEPRRWRRTHGIAIDDRVAVCSIGGYWVREIYGLDMLLESWRIVEESMNARLVILGDLPLDYIYKKSRSLGLKNLMLPGRISLRDVANWINSADVCAAPRTPGYPSHFYNDKDSTKISEYVALKKPIVASGYAPSNQYLLVNQTAEAFAEGIMKGLNGEIVSPRPHYWEENESMMLKLLYEFWFG